jgi:hypothetical protein
LPIAAHNQADYVLAQFRLKPTRGETQILQICLIFADLFMHKNLTQMIWVALSYTIDTLTLLRLFQSIGRYTCIALDARWFLDKSGCLSPTWYYHNYYICLMLKGTHNARIQCYLLLRTTVGRFADNGVTLWPNIVNT